MGKSAKEQIEHLEARLAFAENRMRDLTSRLSDLAPQAFVQGFSGMAKKIVDELIDPDPDRSLTISADIPCAVVRTGLFRGPIRPIDRWREIVSNFSAMPRAFQEKIREQELNPNQLPDWKKIQQIFRYSGFEAIPVYRAVGNLLFQYFISQSKFPVCTEWMMRYSEGPRLTIGDTFHEIGHGFALMQPDYRSYSLEFARGFLKADLVPFGEKVFFPYVRALENSFILDGSQNVVPIGPVSYVLDNLKVENQKLVPRRPIENTSSLAHRPYNSYGDWVADCCALLQSCRAAELGPNKPRNATV